MGEEITFTVAEVVFEQPVCVPVTEYVVLAVGEIVIRLPVMPELHKYVLAPLAINVVVCPEQIVDEFTVTVGKGVTEIVAVVVLEQPKVIPVTE
jgi:hypothetical protein